MRLVVAEAGVIPALTEARRVAVADVLRPLARVALGGLIVVSPFRANLVLDERVTTPIYPLYTNFLLFAGDAFLLALILLWGLSLLVQSRKVWLGPALIRWPIAGLILAIWASVPLSIDPSLSFYNAARLTLMVPLLLYCANEIESVSQLVPALALSIAVQAIVGLGQVIDQQSLGLSGLGEMRLTPDAPSASVVWTEDEPKLLRGYGLTDHPNILGGLLALSLLLLLAGLNATRPFWLSVLSAVFSLGCLALLLSFSRSAGLSFALGLMLVFGLLASRREWSRFSLVLGVCLAAALVGVAFLKPYAPYLDARVNPQSQAQGSTESRSLSERSALAKNANEIFVDHPVTGVGMGGLPLAMRAAYPDFGFDYQPAHVVLLTASAETGLPGAFFYAVLMLTPWGLLWWRRRQLTPELIGVSGALLAVSVIGLFDYYTWSRAPGQVWFLLVLGLWAGAYGRAVKAAADA